MYEIEANHEWEANLEIQKYNWRKVRIRKANIAISIARTICRIRTLLFFFSWTQFWKYVDNENWGGLFHVIYGFEAERPRNIWTSGTNG